MARINLNGLCRIGSAAAVAVLIALAGCAPATLSSLSCTACPHLVALPPGSFLMGAPADDEAADPSEGPAHAVRIARPFALAATPVTVGDFARFVDETGYDAGRGCQTLTDAGWRVDPEASWRAPGFAQAADHPVVCVSWDAAMAYADWLSGTTGTLVRLPGEAEWEYAARGGTQTVNFWGEDAAMGCAFANINDLSGKNKVVKVAEACSDGYWFTSPVAHFRPNRFGLYDMQGNVWEWTADCWQPDFAQVGYKTEAQTDPAPAACEMRTLRGGSWLDTPGPVRIAARLAEPASGRYAYAGFRIAVSLDAAGAPATPRPGLLAPPARRE